MKKVTRPIEGEDDEMNDDDEMDDDTGTLFTPLLNNEALNFFREQ